MKVNLHTPIPEAQVHIIPLIDVIFCILTFFLLATLQFTRQQAVDVKAGTGTVSGITSQYGSQIVTIDNSGNTYIEKELVRREDLSQRLKQYLQENPQGYIVLNASPSATYNDIIAILDLLRQVGGDRVSLGIISGSSQTPTNLLNQPPDSSFPIAPGTAPIPNTVPVPSINPQGTFNPNLPLTPNQVPLPTVTGQPRTGEGINPGVSPLIPNPSASTAPITPKQTQPKPQR